MSSVRAVPETELMGEDLSADDAWHTVRRYHLGRLFATAFVRFRYGDGFSHARAFALQLALAAVPLVIAGPGSPPRSAPTRSPGWWRAPPSRCCSGTRHGAASRA